MIKLLLTALLALAMIPADSPAQQGVEYRIEATLDETAEVLRGRAELRYTNNATVALDTLWLHQHLNAFRPNSAWAEHELELGETQFQDLGPDEHAFDRLGTVTVDGQTIQPIYLGTPDSTVVGFPLASPLAPGATALVRFDWTARPSTLPRRQGRRGRHYDFAQWYPRIAAYTDEGWQVQPLLPQGEFFGEFGTYDVTLDVAADQVIGATGVAVDGDPGWTAAAAPGQTEPELQRDFYPTVAEHSLGLLPEEVAADRKRVRWRAEDVHHFAWSTDPEFVYEGGVVERPDPIGGEIRVHTLYLPEDDDWADGVALNRTIEALDWFQGMLGPYPWPQFTNLHRIESGGTEFPMMIMDGSPSEGLIVHETAHQFFHGILANNEFLEGWLDEGVASFLTDWYHEEGGNPDVWSGSMERIVQLEQRGQTQPIATPGADFVDPATYSAMTYTKTELVLRMLRRLIGEETMRSGLRTLYERHALQHITEADFRAAFEEEHGEDLDWFFDQWLHTTDQLDYSVASATTSPTASQTWTTTVEIERTGDAWMPADILIGEEAGVVDGEESRQVIEVESEQPPEEIILDPQGILIDIDPTNNRLPVTRQ
ncbi:MAG: hypothetical protein GEU90_09725 [Gemmatimonas sp.]|nr:hypothetical protein [Gemmatimonas sp.]